MNIPSSLRITALGLAFGSVAFAQSPPPAPQPPSPPATMPSIAAASPLQPVTESSRVRAFNAAPGGEVRSLYLQNGSVVDLGPDLGGQLGPVIRKGQKITVTGTKSEINGQSLVEAARIQLDDRAFTANPPSTAPAGAGPLAQGAVPPPPAPRRRNKAAAPAPSGVAQEDAPPPPDWGGPPPPLPGIVGPPPPPSDGMAPPPPQD